MKKRRLLIAVTTVMAMVILLSKPAFLNVYAKSYDADEVTIVSTILQEGDKLLFPKWANEGMHIRYFSEDGQVMANINLDKGEDYEIPDYDSLDLSVPIPSGQRFVGWCVIVKPTEVTRGMQWDLQRCLKPAPEQTSKPTDAPEPTDTPTKAPEPTDTPTTAPEPTDTPTTAPIPTAVPTQAPEPTDLPTAVPTQAPEPTDLPTAVPTTAPVATAVPTTVPTTAPVATAVPTTAPTAAPVATAVPTAAPTTAPIPTNEPTTAPVPTQMPTAVPQPTTTPDSTPAPTLVPTPTPEPDTQNTVISQAGTYELQPYIMYLLKGSISHVEGDITNYANPISFTVDNGGTYTFY